MLQEQRHKPQIPFWVRLTMVLIVLLTIVIGAAIWIWISQGSVDVILTIIFSILGVLFAFLQLFPIIFPDRTQVTSTSSPPSAQPAPIHIYLSHPQPSSPDSHQLVSMNSNIVLHEQTMADALPTDSLIPQQQEMINPPEKQDESKSRSVRSKSIFFFSVNLPAASEFFGRVIEVETIINRISHKASTSIVGPRRIGKTWLLEYVMLIAHKRLGTSGFRLGYIDATMPDCATVAGFTMRAAKVFGMPLEAKHTDRGLITLGQIVEELHSRKQVPILCIDEFERFGTRQTFDIDFFTGMRALSHNGLGLVVASKSSLIDIVGDYGKSSGFFNIFEQLTLEPFTPKEAEEFARVKSTQARFIDQERIRLLEYGQTVAGQWPPIRLQLAGKMLLEDKISAKQGESRPEDAGYWQRFEKRLEGKYRAVVR